MAFFRGPSGNQVAVIAGLRDLGAEAAARQLSNFKALEELGKRRGPSDGFEAVYEVQGQEDVDFRTKRVAFYPRGATPPGS